MVGGTFSNVISGATLSESDICNGKQTWRENNTPQEARAVCDDIYVSKGKMSNFEILI